MNTAPTATRGRRGDDGSIAPSVAEVSWGSFHSAGGGGNSQARPPDAVMPTIDSGSEAEEEPDTRSLPPAPARRPRGGQRARRQGGHDDRTVNTAPIDSRRSGCMKRPPSRFG